MSSRRHDSSGAFVLAVAAGPFLLPVLGVKASDLVFAIPLLMTLYAAAVSAGAVRRGGPRVRVWIAVCAANLLAASSSALGLVAAIAGHGALLAFSTGIASSVVLAVGAAALASQARRDAGLVALLDPALVATVLVSVTVYLVVFPGFAGGDLVLTGVLLVDLAAFLCAAVGAMTAAPVVVRAAFAGACVVVAVGDGLATAASAGMPSAPAWVTALLWSAAAGLLALAAGSDGRPGDAPDELSEEPGGRSWAIAHVLLPLGAVLAYPAAYASIVVERGFSWGASAYFAALFLASMLAAFGRQANLLLAHRRAAGLERRLRAEAQRRTAELEALTGLATTMTEVLEEGPMIERGLDALRVAARTSSSALHLFDAQGAPRLAAATGEWQRESVWAPAPAHMESVTAERRARRHIARLPVAARGQRLGVVTLVRADSDAPFDAELELLRLLVDQLAIALQNARDYRDKLDLAIRDPLTGLFNRRFFYEQLDKEVDRRSRYGTGAALVLFDVDDFKSINDTLGHQAGDEALQRIAGIVTGLIRPSDTFARIGGEEFGLLLPETAQLDALLAAERLRTAIAREEVLPGRKVTVSGGVASLPRDGDSREDVERKADQALYWAKRNGKNMCAVASEALDEHVNEGIETMLAHLHAVVDGIDAQHLHTRDHSENVASYAVAIGQELELEPDRIVKLRRAALLLDIGMIAVPGAILSKPGELTDAELAQVRIHPEIGGHMLSHAGLRDEARWVRHHHERMDGGGYPDGVKDDALELEARILFVADSFEAMTADRPYRAGMPFADALAELGRCAGSQFDPAVVAAMTSLVGEGRLPALALRDAR